MKKVSLFNKVVAVIAAVALILTIANTILLVQVSNFARNTDNFMNQHLLVHSAKNAGAINTIISCLEDDQKSGHVGSCGSAVLDSSKRNLGEE